MKLLIDSQQIVVGSIVSEELITEGKTDMYISGIFLQADKRNHNGRIYPQDIMDREVKCYTREFIDTNRALGELNHPPSPSIDPERASHITTEIHRDGSNYIGKAKILDTPMGRIVKGLIQGGVSLGVSSRGLGSVKEGTGANKGTQIIQDDFKLICVDVVSNPSAPEAFVKGIYESADYQIRNGKIFEVTKNEEIVVNIKRTLDSVTRSDLKEMAFANQIIALVNQL